MVENHNPDLEKIATLEASRKKTEKNAELSAKVENRGEKDVKVTAMDMMQQEAKREDYKRNDIKKVISELAATDKKKLLDTTGIDLDQYDLDDDKQRDELWKKLNIKYHNLLEQRSEEEKEGKRERDRKKNLREYIILQTIFALIGVAGYAYVRHNNKIFDKSAQAIKEGQSEDFNYIHFGQLDQEKRKPISLIDDLAGPGTLESLEETDKITAFRIHSSLKDIENELKAWKAQVISVSVEKEDKGIFHLADHTKVGKFGYSAFLVDSVNCTIRCKVDGQEVAFHLAGAPEDIGRQLKIMLSGQR